MTAAEKKEFEALQKEVKTLKTALADVLTTYKTINEVPSSFRSTITKLKQEGIIAGKSASNLGISYEDCRHLVWADRMREKDKE